jgi:peptidoglycan/LPS O-acetylase OafA/YrhL
MVIMTLWNPRPMALLLNTLYAVGYGAWVRYFYDLKWSPVFAAGRLARKGVQGIALCSYSVYLTHTTFDPAIRGHVLAGMHRGVGKSILVLSSTFLLGVGFYFLVERPTILTRDIYLKGRKSSVVDPRRAVLLSQVPTTGASWPVVD